MEARTSSEKTSKCLQHSLLQTACPRLFFKAGGAAVLQLGLVKTSPGPSPARKFLGRSLGYPGPTWYLLGRFGLMNRFEDCSWGSQSQGPSCPYALPFPQWGLCCSPALTRGQPVVSRGNHRWEGWPWAVIPPLSFGPGTRKSFMGWCGESRWEPALFYFRNVFLVELILWKISVSGLVCLCRPLRLAAGCQVPWVCKEAQPDMFSVQGPHPGDPLIFPSLPSSLTAAAAWKLIPQPLAFGRRTLPSYGKVFNTNLMVCLATVCPEPALLP